MTRDMLKISCALSAYIRELDNEAFERLSKTTWITESLGTEEFCRRTPEEILEALRAKLPEEDLSPGPWFDSLIHIAKQWAKLNLYANMAWPGKLVELYEKHGVKS